MRKIVLASILVCIGACQSAYYEAAEKVGYHKRDILVDRVEDSRDAQQDAEEEFQSALEQLSVMVNFDGGDLEDMYDDMVDVYEDSASAAAEVTERIDAVEHVANSLFEEWQDEIGEYSSARLKADSQAKLRETKRRYDQMLTAMRRSEAKMAPVLTALNDNVLYLKHNLNAQALGSLTGTLAQLEGDIDTLIREMQSSIREADSFIEEMAAED